MTKAVKLLNKYEIKRMALNEKKVDYNNFYKDELVSMLICANQEYNKLNKAIDKAIDKLYIWGETLDPTFQKEMLDILKGMSE